MTVKELREKLYNVPDNWPVYIMDGEYGALQAIDTQEGDIEIYNPPPKGKGLMQESELWKHNFFPKVDGFLIK